MLPFTKMHGAGNDFILIDNRNRTFPTHATSWMNRIGARKTGVGCDGFVLVEAAEADAHFRMRFFNPDGNEAEMCGNGARCVARYASDRDIAPSEMTFETVAGNVSATVVDDQDVRIDLPPPSHWEEELTIPEIMGTAEGQWINSGVPHAVFPVDSLQQFDVALVGRKLRWHSRFQPDGTNADFFTIVDDVVVLRTYERGVEAETLACGTGMVATALCAFRMGLVKPPVTMRCMSGDTLVVDFATDKKITSVSLTGPAVYVYDGELPDPKFRGV